MTLVTEAVYIKLFSFASLGDRVQEVTWQLYNDLPYPSLSQFLLPRITGSLIHVIARICDCVFTLIAAMTYTTDAISYQVFNLVYSIQDCQQITDPLFKEVLHLSGLCLFYLLDIPTAAICNAIYPPCYKKAISLFLSLYGNEVSNSTHLPSTPGFKNQDANCCFNACLQVILHHPERLQVYKVVANYYHDQKNQKDKACGKNMLDVLAAYGDALQSGKSIAEDISYKLRLAMHHLNAQIAKGSRYEDAHEILTTLTGKYEEILIKRAKQNHLHQTMIEENLLKTSAIHFKNIITRHYAIGEEVEIPNCPPSCLNENNTFVQEELQSQLKIALDPAHKTLHFKELLQNFFSRIEENVTDAENSTKLMKDGKCFYVNLTKEEQKFREKPNNLTMQFARFVHDKKEGPAKIHSSITDIPERLDARSLAIENSPSGAYELTSFIVHVGVSSGGHYFAYIKKEDGWIKCDDDRTFYVDKSTFLEDLANSYMCFYKLQEG